MKNTLHPTFHCENAEFKADLVASLPSLRSFARNFLSDPADIEDLVQDVAMKAIRFSHQYSQGTSIKSWLYKILRNSFYTQYRRNQRACISYHDEPPEHPSAPSQLWNLQHKELLSAINKLSPDRREVLILIAEGVSYEEAAKQMGCQIGTIKSRVSRARKDLNEALSMPFG